MQDEKQLFEMVTTAFYDFLDQHAALLDVNANERSITHKLAETLQEAFSNMDVDCEYNRHGRSAKTILAHRNEDIRPDDLEAKTVYPDIVVHTRGMDTNNVLVVEVKKQNNSRRHSDDDSEKLKAFTGNEFRYQVGLYVEIDTKRKSIGVVKCYKDGNEVKDSIWDRLEFRRRHTNCDGR